MLRITELHADGRLVLKLEGRFLRPWVPEVDTCWRTAAAKTRDAIWLDLSDVSHVDAEAEEQLARMHRAGVQFLARGCAMCELVREIAGCQSSL